jgi:hypothetical protein
MVLDGVVGDAQVLEAMARRPWSLETVGPKAL